MSKQAVYEYLLAILAQYQSASKREKSNLLDQAEKVTKLSRKNLIRKLNKSSEALGEDSHRKRPGAPPKYPKELLSTHLHHLWVQMERISAPRMKQAYVDWLPFYKEADSRIKALMCQMSASTLERFLREIRGKEETQKGLSSRCPARYMKNKIPLQVLDFKATEPGFTQADTVAHCGSNLSGAFASSLTMVDLWSTWTENRALLSKKSSEVRARVKDIEECLPFALKAIHTDSGSEFLNNNMINFANRNRNGKHIALTRSRPYRKNDNCFVEQKNYTHVRELFGYERIEDERLVKLMDEIYTNYWNPLQNFFLPNFKLKEKVRIGAKIKKTYDKPMTPYDRLMKSDHLSDTQKRALAERKRELNPFTLKQGGQTERVL
jgi:hypothetical protein